MPNYVESKEIGPLSYRIEKRGRRYRLWLNGCGIGRPRPDKPPGEMWEYSAKTLTEARKEIDIDARERLEDSKCQLEIQILKLNSHLAGLKIASSDYMAACRVK